MLWAITSVIINISKVFAPELKGCYVIFSIAHHDLMINPQRALAEYIMKSLFKGLLMRPPETVHPDDQRLTTIIPSFWPLSRGLVP